MPEQRVRQNDMSGEAREVTRNGRDYLVFPIIAAREMVMDYPEHGTRELLPSDRLRESAEMWAGTPITFIHPENEQRTADIPEEYTETVIGQAYNPSLVDDEKLRVQAWVDVDKAESIGGLASDVVNQLRNGEDVSVSAGYATLDDDRSGGTFNNEEYDIAQGYIIPDHIAVFPSDEFTARCSWEDGCGAPRANAMERAYTYVGSCSDTNTTCSPGECSCGYHANAMETAREPTYDGLTSAEWEPPTFTEYAEAYYEQSEEDAPDNITVNEVSGDALAFITAHTLVGDPNGDSAGQVRSFPVVNLDGELNEDALTSARLLAHNSPAESSIRATAAELLEEHADEWPSGQSYDFSDESQNYGSSSGDDSLPEDVFETKFDAMARARALGCEDTHETSDGNYMPCETHEKYEEQRDRDNYRSESPLSTDGTDRFDDEDAARARAIQIGCDGIHEHPHRYKDGETIYMPCETHAEYDKRLRQLRENIGSETGNISYLRAGEYVQWDAGRMTHKGRVRATAESGCLSVVDNKMCATADNERVVSVERYENGVPTGVRVLKLARDGEPNQDGLRSWDAPRRSREMDDRPVEMRNAVPEPGWQEGDLVHYQGMPDLFGMVVHKDERNHQAMVEIHGVEDGELYSSGYTYSAGYSDIVKMADRDVPTDQPPATRDNITAAHNAAITRTRTNQITVDIGDREVDLTPPDAVVNAADAALTAKQETYPDEIGECGTGVGEQRANQLIDGDLAPEDFLTRENGTPYPVYLDSHGEDAPSTDETPTSWGEDEWTDGCGPVQYALWGGTGTDTAVNWADGVRSDLEAAIEAAEDFTLNAHIVTMSNEQITADDLSLRHNVAPYLADVWGMDDVGLVEAFTNSLDPSEPEGAQAFAATIANAYDGVDAVDVQAVLADAEARDTATLDLNYEPPSIDVDGGVGPHIDRLNARENVAPFLADRWETDPSETIALINAIDPNQPDDFRALVNTYPTEYEQDTEVVASKLADATTQPDKTNAVSEETAETLFGKFLQSIGWSPESTDVSQNAETPSPDQPNSSTEMRTNAIEVEEGDTVQWDWSGGTAYGMVEEVVMDGSRTVGGNTREVDADDGEAIAVLEQMNEDGEAQDQQVIKYVREDEENENNLRMWDAPEPSENAMPSAPADVSPEPVGDNAQTTEATNTTTATNNGVTMDMTINQLAAQTAFGVSELQEWDDSQLAALETTVNERQSENAEHGMHGGEDEEEDEEEEEEEEEEEMTENAQEKIDSLEQQVSELKVMVEDVANKKANAEKEQQARIVANAIEGMDKETALELSSEKLSDLADTHANTVNYSGVPGQKDRGGMRTNTGVDEDERDQYPAGGRSNWEQRKSGGD
jgi:hypothetical protein